MRSTPSLRSFPNVAFKTVPREIDDGPLTSPEGRSSSASSFNDSNRLKLKDNKKYKKAAVVVGSRSLTNVSGTGQLKISSRLMLSFRLKVKDMGGILSSRFATCDNISSVCRSVYLELRNTGSVHPFLTVETVRC